MLLELIEELPIACRWREAAQNDPDYLAMLEERAYEELKKNDKPAEDDDEDADSSDWSPRFQDYRLEHMQNGRIISLLGTILQAVGGGEIPADYGRFPEPQNPYEAAKERADMRLTEEKVDKAFAALFKPTTKE